MIPEVPLAILSTALRIAATSRGTFVGKLATARDQSIPRSAANPLLWLRTSS
jgi:hypothetical protein